MPARASRSRRCPRSRGALALAEEFERLGGFGPEQGLTFFCRVGVSDPPGSRSLRKGSTS
jgi:hypothetical protein